jgi:hypothetical protein
LYYEAADKTITELQLRLFFIYGLSLFPPFLHQDAPLHLPTPDNHTKLVLDGIVFTIPLLKSTANRKNEANRGMVGLSTVSDNAAAISRLHLQL